MLQREIDPGQAADIEKFERVLAGYLAGDIEEDVFRVFRLHNGIYGQRQGGHNQMVRVKLPYGGITPEQLDALADLVDEYSRGWGHITTRQNVQVHFVPLERVPDAMRTLAEVGLTTREACGDTVRNVMGCHLAGACPHEKLDITQWAEAAFRHLLRGGFHRQKQGRHRHYQGRSLHNSRGAWYSNLWHTSSNRRACSLNKEARIFESGSIYTE